MGGNLVQLPEMNEVDNSFFDPLPIDPKDGTLDGHWPRWLLSPKGVGDWQSDSRAYCREARLEDLALILVEDQQSRLVWILETICLRCCSCCYETTPTSVGGYILLSLIYSFFWLGSTDVNYQHGS